MKKFYFFLLLFLCLILSNTLQAQRVGINTNTPDPSSVLDIHSTDKGLLIPRVSLVDVSNATSPISNPATGLMVYNINTSVTGGDGEGFYVFNGSQWLKVRTGNNPLGGDDDWTVNGNDQYSAVSGNVGIGTPTPDATLHVAGNIKIVDGSQGAGKVLTSDTNGLASWQNVPGIDDIRDADGDTKIQVEESTDEDIIRFDVKGTEAMAIDDNGQVGIGVTDPQARLHVTAGYVGSISVDQQQTNVNNLLPVLPTAPGWQSFTAGADGDLQRVNFVRNGPSSSSYTITIYEGQGTGGTSLASKTVSVTGYNFVQAVFTAGEVTLRSGQVYTIGLSTSEYLWYKDGDVYSGGRADIDPTYDYYFSVYSTRAGDGFRVSDNGVQINDYTLPIVDGSSNQVMTTDGSGAVSWQDPNSLVNVDDGDWTVSGNDIYNTAFGNVGIGVDTPQARLHIAAGYGGPVVVDQAQTIGSNGYGNLSSSVYQTYTAGMDGQVAQVLFQRYANAGTSRTYTVAIYEGTGNGGTLLGSTTYTATNTVNGYEVHTVNINGGAQIKGQVYSLWLSTYRDVGSRSGNPYSGGELSTSSFNDLYFQIKVRTHGNGVQVSDNGLLLNEYTLPLTDGSANQVLKTDGNGNMSWVSLSGGNQTLSLSGNNLTISSGNAVNLSSVDDQTLSFNTSSNQLTIAGGNSVSLSSLADDGDWTISGNNLYNNNTGFVGIGEISPLARLHIDDNDVGISWTPYSQTTAILERTGGSLLSIVSNNTGISSIVMGDSDAQFNGRLRYEHTDDRMEIWTANSEKMSILSNGNVGVGEPDPTERLHVQGNIRMIDGNQALNYILASDANGVAHWTDPATYFAGTGTIWANYGNDIANVNTGNVGIGTSTPAYKLDIPSTATGVVVAHIGYAFIRNRASGQFHIVNDAFTTGNNAGFGMNSGGLLTLGGFNNDIVFYGGTDANSETVRIKNTGSVGIGTNNPTAKLDVNGNFNLGSNGTTLSSIVYAAVPRDVGNINANSNQYEEFTVNGAQLGGAVSISPSEDLPSNLVIAQAYVSATNTVRVKFRTTASSSVNPANMTYYISVINPQ